MPVPKLRFTDDQGQNYPVWTIKPLKDVTNRIIVGLATSVTPYYRKNGVPILRNLNIKENRLDDSDLLYLDEAYAAKQSNKKIHTGDVLTVHTGYVGISCLVPPKYDNCQTFTTLITTTNSAILNNRFFCQYINSPLGLSRVYKVITSGGRSNLNTGDFVNFPTPISSLPEQGKIADFLSTYDRMIDIQSQRVEAMKTRKKGLLQKIFSQEIRFKDNQGRDYPEWKKALFCDLFSSLRKNILSRDALNYECGSLRNIHYGDILVKFPATIQSLDSNIPYVNANKIPKTYDVLKTGDIIIADTAEDETAGKGVELIEDSIPVISGLHTLPYRPKVKFACGYLGYFLNSTQYHKQLLPLLHGIKVLSLTKAELEKTVITYPSLPEQQKIAGFLTAVDAQIDVEEKRLETMKTIKKGLLQQMFI